jgi:CheY-like chemotaxis protein
MARASEKKILVVDDEPDVRDFLASCIEDAGFIVTTAVDGQDALEKIEADTPDLMTLDMVMPRKSGIKVIRTLRETEKYANLPIIVITAHARDEFGSEDFKEFNAFTSGLRPRYTIEKPVTPARLIKSICEILSVSPESTDQKKDPQVSERDKLINLIKSSDEKTLSKIRDLIKNK